MLGRSGSTTRDGWADGDPHHVVVVGGGFGGLQVVRNLRRAPVVVTLVDRRNFHLFQPLLYQVATGGLASGEIASPLRGILKGQRNARVVLGEVTGFDLSGRRVLLDQLGNGGEAAISYDTLVVATGATHAYFSHDEWRPLAPGLKTLEDATEIRRRILIAFEAAEVEPDPVRRAAWLTFVVVGGGPTGVEVAGQIAELARDTLSRDFRRIDPRGATVLLVESNDRLPTAFPPALSAAAARALERLGVTPVLGHLVDGVDAESVTLRQEDGTAKRISTRTVVWAAGVQASPLAAALGEATGAAVDRAGRVAVGPNLTLPGHSEVFALGDMVRVYDTMGQELPLPGVAPVAMQQGRYVAATIRTGLIGRSLSPFRYRDKGNVATIGRLQGVADIGGRRLTGVIAWLTWLFVHLFYLVGFQNRILVFIRWIGGFLTRGRGTPLITGEVVNTGATIPASRPSRWRAQDLPTGMLLGAEVGTAVEERERYAAV